MGTRYAPSSAAGRRSKTLLVNQRVRCCLACLARGVRVSATCRVDGDVACDICHVRPSRGVLGLREVAP